MSALHRRRPRSARTARAAAAPCRPSSTSVRTQAAAQMKWSLFASIGPKFSPAVPLNATQQI